jgi:hypothetical protein
MAARAIYGGNGFPPIEEQAEKIVKPGSVCAIVQPDSGISELPERTAVRALPAGLFLFL